ncbi:MAG: CPBP family intramembrane metalloprotease, partial [Candidatus Moranbacteria bacterium]|jgi:membrane protease YdiL (CAAX protease family)|nr:CPBP family intramembrane metalloprotease [Candidatus Moranbacteria bacterium]
LQTSLVSIFFIFISIQWLTKYKLGAGDIRLLSFQKTGFSLETILILFIQSIIRTSFLEEIVFRGFLINFLKGKFGFNKINHIQATIFSALHIFAMVGFSLVDILAGTIIIYILSLYFGKLTRKSGDSIFYSSVFHGSLNIIAGLIFILMAI